MLFQLPGLNSIYYKYKSQNIDTIKKAEKLSKLSGIRMMTIFLLYLIPLIIGFIAILQDNLIAYFICIGICLTTLIANFYLDSKMAKNTVSEIIDTQSIKDSIALVCRHTR